MWVGGYIYIPKNISAALPFLVQDGSGMTEAVRLDLDPELLNWCMENNINKVGAGGYCRMSLFHGNVLQPIDAKIIKFIREVEEKHFTQRERRWFGEWWIRIYSSRGLFFLTR